MNNRLLEIKDVADIIFNTKLTAIMSTNKRIIKLTGIKNGIRINKVFCFNRRTLSKTICKEIDHEYICN